MNAKTDKRKPPEKKTAESVTLNVTDEWDKYKHLFSDRTRIVFENYIPSTVNEYEVVRPAPVSDLLWTVGAPLRFESAVEYLHRATWMRRVSFCAFLGLHIPHPERDKEAAVRELARVLGEMAEFSQLEGVLLRLSSIPAQKESSNFGLVVDPPKTIMLPQYEPDGEILVSYPHVINATLLKKLWPDHVNYEGDKPKTWIDGKIIG